MSSSLQDETSRINKQEESIIASNVDETTNRELPLSESSVVEESTSTQEETSVPELPLSESSVVEEAIINDQASTEKELPLSKSSVVEEKQKVSSIKNVCFVRSKWTEIFNRRQRRNTRSI